MPKKFDFYFKTHAGRLIVLSGLFFLVTSFLSGSFLSPTNEVLLQWGAKNNILIIHGEYWRLFTPMFLHFGIAHFFLNALALKAVGFEIEKMMGGRYFLIIYFFSGIVGNLASSMFNTSLSVGASGAIFGLVGCGVFLETLVAFNSTAGKDFSVRMLNLTKLGPYRMMTVLNFALALVINVGFEFFDWRIAIDHMSHTGGLLSGFFVTWIIFSLNKNNLFEGSKKQVMGLILSVGLCFMYMAHCATSRSHGIELYYKQALKSSDPREAYFLLSQGLKIEKNASKLLIERGKLLLFNNEKKAAIHDFELALQADDRNLVMETLQFDLKDSRYKSLLQYLSAFSKDK